MALDFVEIRNADRVVIGILDTARSVIWHGLYFGVGDFEIYAEATDRNIALLVAGNYVTRPGCRDIGIIENINISYNVVIGRMITATGRFAKSILDRRHIYNLSGNKNRATILIGNVETAVREVVKDNIIACDFDSRRNISFIELGALANLTEAIEAGAEKQVYFENLLEYTDSVLTEFELSAQMVLDDETKKLQYLIYKGVDRSTENTANNTAVIFSPEFDNLVESDFDLQTLNEKNAVLIGGEGNGEQRFYCTYDDNKTGLARRETWADAGSVSKTYETKSGASRTYTTAEYIAALQTEGKQQIAEFKRLERFTGAINTSFGQWQLYRDFNLGDIVTVQDKQINRYASARIIETLETQDENGYTAEVTFL